MKDITKILIGLGFGIFVGYFIKDQLTPACPAQIINQITYKGIKAKRGSTLSLQSYLESKTQQDTTKVRRKSRKRNQK